MFAYVDALASAGKSYAVRRYAAQLSLSGKQVLVIQPSKILLEESVRDFKNIACGIEPELIHSDQGSDETVTQRILNTLDQPHNGGRLLLITWSGFLGLPYFPGKGRWTMFVDEVPQAIETFQDNVPATHHHLTDHLTIYPTGPAFGILRIADDAGLKLLAESSDISLRSFLRPVARQLRLNKHDFYTPLKTYHELVRSTGKRLALHSVLRPDALEGFESVTILGANLKNSLLYKIWDAKGTVFREHSEITSKLRFHTHTNGRLLRICYFIDEPWSNKIRKGSEKKLLRRMVDATAREMDGKDFLWIDNKDTKTNLFPMCSGAKRLEANEVCGINTYSHVDNAVFLAARNPYPTQFDFLGWLGVDGDEVRQATYLEVVYQAALRTSLRDRDSEANKTIIVPDLSAAKFLKSLFPGAFIEKLPIDMTGIGIPKRPGRKKQHDNSTIRSREYRAQLAVKFNTMLTGAQSAPMIDSSVALSPFQLMKEKSCNGIPIREESLIQRKTHGSTYQQTNATTPVNVVADLTTEEFIYGLKQCSRKEIYSKKDRRLISPSVCDPDLHPDHYRALPNVVFANGIWLDFDGGDLTHQMFARLLPHLRMVAFNTYSSTKSIPRFRIYIPTLRTMTADEYDLVTKQIMQVLRNEGYYLAKRDPLRPGKAHGVDTGKLTAVSLFYLPCRPKDSTGRIWKDFKDRDRKPLNVSDWIENGISLDTNDDDRVSEPSHVADREVDHAAVAEALRRWGEIGVLEGNGNAEIFTLQLSLKSAQVPPEEAKRLALEAAAQAKSPRDRERDVLRNHKKLRKIG